MNPMPYLIDGHNLIPKIPGLALRQIDDEMHLVELLQDFCRRTHKKVEVYFDNAPPGQPAARSFGNVLARFIREGKSADQAIRLRLARLGGAARNWILVSSDREVQAAGRAVRARVISSEDFAVQLLEVIKDKETPSGQLENRPEGLTAEEVDEWMDIFGFDGNPPEQRDRGDRE
jgi:predicted RNA-binding protein with PIN domain